MVSVQRLSFFFLFYSDILGSGIYFFHMAEKEHISCWGIGGKNPRLMQHKKLLIVLDRSTRNRCHHSDFLPGRVRGERNSGKLQACCIHRSVLMSQVISHMFVANKWNKFLLLWNDSLD